MTESPPATDAALPPEPVLHCPTCGAEVHRGGTASARPAARPGLRRADRRRRRPGGRRRGAVESPITLSRSVTAESDADTVVVAAAALRWTAAARSGRTATARSAGPRRRPARPLRRAAGDLGRRGLRPGHPAPPQRGRHGDRGRRGAGLAGRAGGLRRRLHLDRLRRRQPGRGPGRPRRAGGPAARPASGCRPAGPARSPRPSRTPSPRPTRPCSPHTAPTSDERRRLHVRRAVVEGDLVVVRQRRRQPGLLAARRRVDGPPAS